MKQLKVTGRILPISEATKKRNPELYGSVVNPVKCGCAPFEDCFECHPEKYAKPKSKPRIRQSTKPLLNKLETEFQAVLKGRFPDTLITANSTRFRLANGLWYKPDFIVWDRHHIMCWEVKGPYAFRGGFENLKMGASKYPEFYWYLAWKDKATGQWREQPVLP